MTGDFGVSTIMDDARTRTRTTVGMLKVKKKSKMPSGPLYLGRTDICG